MSYVAPFDSFFKSRGFLIGTPSKGMAERCLDCDQYDRCLDHAAACDWEGFNCLGCGYPYRGRLYDLSGYELEDDDDTLYFPTEGQIDGLLGTLTSQEDILIEMIIEGLIDEK